MPSRGFGDFMFKHGPVVRTERLRGEDEELTDAEGAGIDQPPPPTLLPPSKQAVSCVPDVVVRQRSKRCVALSTVMCADNSFGMSGTGSS